MTQNAIPTLQDVLDRIDAMEPGTRKRDLKSAVNSFCRAVARQPGEIAAVPHQIRKLREGISPMAQGIDPRRWANICSGMAKAVELVRPCLPSRNTDPIHPDWQVLLKSLPTQLVRKVSPATRYLSSRDVLPATVTVEDLTAYCDAIVADRLRRHAEKAADEFLWGWNRTVE